MIDEIASNDFQMIYIASCGEGINAFNLVESTLVQFPDSQISVVKVAHIRSESQVDELIDKVKNIESLILLNKLEGTVTSSIHGKKEEGEDTSPREEDIVERYSTVLESRLSRCKSGYGNAIG